MNNNNLSSNDFSVQSNNQILDSQNMSNVFNQTVVNSNQQVNAINSQQNNSNQEQINTINSQLNDNIQQVNPESIQLNSNKVAAPTVLNSNISKKKKGIFAIIVAVFVVVSLAFSVILILNKPKKSAETILKDAKYEYKVFLYGTKYVDYFNSVVGTEDNGYVAVGNTVQNSESCSYDNSQYGDAVIVKYDSSNQIEWEKFYSSKEDDIYDIFTDINVTENGEYIVSARINGKAVRNSLYYDAAIFKYDKKGKLLWKKILEGNKNDKFEKILILSSGEIVVVGSSSSLDIDGVKPVGEEDAIIAKYDKDGNLLWIKNYGGNNKDIFKSVVELKDGSLVAVGQAYQPEFNGMYDAIAVKYDKDGNLIWVKNFGGSKIESFYDVVATSNDEIIAVGESDSKDIENVNFKGDLLAIAAKYDKDGNYIGLYTYGTRFYNSFQGIINYNDKYLLSGYASVSNRTDTESLFIELNDNLELFSEKIISGSVDDYPYKAAVMKDTGYVSVGRTASSFDNLKNNGLSDGLIIRKQNINY